MVFSVPATAECSAPGKDGSFVPCHIFVFVFASVNTGKEQDFSIFLKRRKRWMALRCNLIRQQSYFRTVALFFLVKLVVGHAD